MTNYPWSTIFVIINSFFERFAFYGIRTTLSLYLKNALDVSEADATLIYHAFFTFSYFTPLLGAIIADSYVGNYFTIISFTGVFITGSALLALSAIPTLGLPILSLCILGLVLISLGSGGIKPCISTFGADQFKLPLQAAQLSVFFALFSWAGNAANLASTLVAPILRSEVSCFGQDSCYSLIFILSAGLLLISLVVMVASKRAFFMKPCEGNVLVQVSKCIGFALLQKSKTEKQIDDSDQVHWLDKSKEKYGDKLVNDIKIVMGLMWLYLPLPIFWALFDQQGSRWTFQASRMSGKIGDVYTIMPDQFQFINRICILILIPLFDRVVYPLLGKCNLLKKPLHRILSGGILAGIAFVLAGLVEMELQKDNDSSIHMMWQFPQYFIMTVAEVMFQITGMEFSYSEAPSSMKSLMQAIWLLTSAVGNLLVIIIAKFRIFENPSYEYFLFAALMFVDVIVFGYVAHIYMRRKRKSAIDETSNCRLNLSEDSRTSFEDEGLEGFPSHCPKVAYTNPGFDVGSD